MAARGADGTPAGDSAWPHKWPQALWLVRHGQSAGNVARDVAEQGGLSVIDIADRDIDVPLSELGRRQASALGAWIGGLAMDERPSALLCSPYLRARRTMDVLVEQGGLDPDAVRVDERLREKEFGILDRLTRRGIEVQYPKLAEQRAHVGKFYFRPPGGESWCDVILRLRSVLDTLTREYRGERVLIVSHQVVVNCMRYLMERLDERAILDIDAQGDVPNCGVTGYEFDPSAGRRGKLCLSRLNFVAPLRNAATPVTSEPDQPVATKP